MKDESIPWRMWPNWSKKCATNGRWVIDIELSARKLFWCCCFTFQILSISDIVLNHTANDSPWLQEHPESTYNLINSPHLRPAYLFDRLLHYLAVDIGAGKYNDRGIDTSITNDDQIEVYFNIYYVTRRNCLNKISLWGIEYRSTVARTTNPVASSAWILPCRCGSFGCRIPGNDGRTFGPEWNPSSLCIRLIEAHPGSSVPTFQDNCGHGYGFGFI